MQESDNRVQMNDFFEMIDKLHKIDIEINKELLSYLLLIRLPENFQVFKYIIQSRDNLSNINCFKIKFF